MSTVSNLLREVKARLTGDKAEMASIRFEKVVTNGLKEQINQLESQIDKQQFAIENAEEKLKTIKYPDTVEKLIHYTDGDNITQYFQAVIDQEAEITRLEKGKKEMEKSLHFYKNAQTTWLKQVEEDKN